MNLTQIGSRARSLVRDLTRATFRTEDITDFANEGIDRVIQVIPQLEGMAYLDAVTDEVTHIPRHYQHLLALYCASRLCTQDERFYQAGNFMNEFEAKLLELKGEIDSGNIEILDPETGEPIEISGKAEYVKNTYYYVRNRIPYVEEE